MKELAERIAKLRGEALAIKLEVDADRLMALRRRNKLESDIKRAALSKYLDLVDLMLERAEELAENMGVMGE